MRLVCVAMLTEMLEARGHSVILWNSTFNADQFIVIYGEIISGSNNIDRIDRWRKRLLLLYLSLRLALLLSKKEHNLPNFIRINSESMGFGLPILLFTDGFMFEMINKHQCGLPYDTPEQLAQNILCLKQDIDLYTKMRNNAKVLFYEKFEGTKVNANMADHLEKLATSAKGDNA